MRYYTFSQDISDESGAQMMRYLHEMGIKFTMGADFSHELLPFGYFIDEGMVKKKSASLQLNADDRFLAQYLVNTFVILGTEDDLTAIKMRFDKICVLKNRTSLNVRNFFRKIFFM